RRHTRSKRDWSSDVCSSDLLGLAAREYVGKAVDHQAAARREAPEALAQSRDAVGVEDRVVAAGRCAVGLGPEVRAGAVDDRGGGDRKGGVQATRGGRGRGGW